MRVLFLDVDGVLNRTGYRPRESHGLRSWIEPELAERLNHVLRTLSADVVMSSDWRLHRTEAELGDELAAAGITCTLRGTTPVLPDAPRWREIEAWMTEHTLAPSEMVIVDDMFDMGDLAARFVRTSALAGLDDAAASSLIALFRPA